jgi:selenide, water dikinase
MSEGTAVIRLTQFSKGGGCGCKIAPAVLEQILKNRDDSRSPGLLVGNETRDDAAVLDIGNGQALISTTDFFIPIVDDPCDFGRIAAANAISDVYAMGGKPVLAIAQLGWPVEKLSAEEASRVIEGAREICALAGIPLAGGHSIDSPAPFFGLAVNGITLTGNIKRNSTAREGDLLFLTKPLGTGIMGTALKRGILKEEDYAKFVSSMCQLNSIGEKLGPMKGVNALTDVTGFGLIGHLMEMAEGSGLSAELNFPDIPVIDGLNYYTDQFCLPDNTYRNWNSYEPRVGGINGTSFMVLCDPQTSGGLLVSVQPSAVEEYISLARLYLTDERLLRPVGRLCTKKDKTITVTE